MFGGKTAAQRDRELQQRLQSQRISEDARQHDDRHGLAVDQFQQAAQQWQQEFTFREAMAEVAQEQWQAEFDFSKEQFETATGQWQQEFDRGGDQWQSEFDFSKEQFETSVGQWQQEFDRGGSQWQAAFDQSTHEFDERQQLARDQFGEGQRQFDLGHQLAVGTAAENAALNWANLFESDYDGSYSALGPVLGNVGLGGAGAKNFTFR